MAENLGRRWTSLAVKWAPYLFAVLFLVFLVRVARLDGYQDFDVYHRVARRMTEGRWLDVYSLADLPGIFRYSPFSFALVFPWGWLDLNTARILWYLLSCGLWLGVYRVLARTLASISQESRQLQPPAGILAIAFLFNARFLIDNALIGQVSAWMMLGIGLAWQGWIQNRPRLFAAGIWIPSVLKLGTLAFVAPWARMPFRSIFRFGMTFLFLCICSYLPILFGLKTNLEQHLTLWSQWMQTLGTVLTPTSQDYLDCSHYGSQALNSALLRWSEHGWISANAVFEIWSWGSLLAFGLVALLGVVTPWRQANSLERTLMFAFAIQTYLVWMPFTAKYSLTFLLIPMIALLWEKSLRGRRILIGGFLAFLTLPGKDIVGSDLFFGIQKLSLPAFVLLGIWLSLLIKVVQISLQMRSKKSV